MPLRKKSSLKSLLQMVLNSTPALFRQAFRLSIPTSPGHWPDQLAIVKIGPRWLSSPERTLWLYCQTASTTIMGASGSSVMKTSMPMRWLYTNPWPSSALKGLARRILMPSAAKASITWRSTSAWAAQQTWLADWRRSPLEIRYTSSAARDWGVSMTGTAYEDMVEISWLTT